MPTTPQSAAGWRIERPVSVPRDAAANPAATAAAEAPLAPAGTCVRSHGLWVGWNAEFSVDEPMANSSMFVLPSTTAPASDSRRTTVASYGGTKPLRMRDAQVVSIPDVQKMSL